MAAPGISTPTDASRGWVLYDGRCSMCRRSAQRFKGLLARMHFELAPLQEPWVAATLDMSEEELLRDMKVLTRQGEVLRGVDGLIFLSRQVWWGWWFYALSKLPGAHAAMTFIYGKVAQHRFRISSACGFDCTQDAESGDSNG